MNVIQERAEGVPPPQYEDVVHPPQTFERDFILPKGTILKIHYNDYGREIKYKYYFPTGELSRVVHYSSSGELDGDNIIYNKVGSVIVRRQMKDGFLQHLTTYDKYGLKTFDEDMRKHKIYMNEKYNYRTNIVERSKKYYGFLSGCIIC